MFRRVLPADEAALINGITLGGYDGLSPELKSEMRHSGTLHLVALSGYNITIILAVVTAACLAFLKRRAALSASVAMLALFVLMTGAEASVIRAALMGGITTLAGAAGRVRDVKNIIAGAAALMVLMNPKTLVFDTGFQLSFLALLGIVCLRPFLKRLSRFADKGLLSWKENALTTVSAQLAVAPLLLAQFGGLSLASLPANVAVLWLIPWVMFLGFTTAILGFVAYPFALVSAYVLHIPLAFIIAIIRLFG